MSIPFSKPITPDGIAITDINAGDLVHFEYKNDKLEFSKSESNIQCDHIIGIIPYESNGCVRQSEVSNYLGQIEVYFSYCPNCGKRLETIA